MNFQIPSRFQMVIVCLFVLCAHGTAIFIPCATVQCIVPTCSWSMDSYVTATTDNGLKTSCIWMSLECLLKD